MSENYKSDLKIVHNVKSSFYGLKETSSNRKDSGKPGWMFLSLFFVGVTAYFSCDYQC